MCTPMGTCMHDSCAHFWRQLGGCGCAGALHWGLARVGFLVHASTLSNSLRSSIGGQGTHIKIDPGQKNLEPVHVHISSETFYACPFFCVINIVHIISRDKHSLTMRKLIPTRNLPKQKLPKRNSPK